jgi:hypothetical protein
LGRTPRWRTKDAILLPWADGVSRLTRLFIGGVLGDQQEGDKYTGEPCVCHRCFAPRKRYLETADFEAKTMRKVCQKVELAAAGGYLKGRRNSYAGREVGSGRPQCTSRTRYYCNYTH